MTGTTQAVSLWDHPLHTHHSLKSPVVLVRFDHVARFIVNANHNAGLLR